MDRVEEALDKSRQAAEVQRGITIGTGATQVTLPEAVVAPRVTVTSREGVASVVRPQFVGAVVSSGGRYSVVWTMRQDGFRAVLFDKVRDRQITSNRNLWWLLLLFAELERREQARKQEREAAQSNT